MKEQLKIQWFKFRFAFSANMKEQLKIQWFKFRFAFSAIKVKKIGCIIYDTLGKVSAQN